MKQRLSLKGRGLQWLAQREHSRVELRQKLMACARAEMQSSIAAASAAAIEATPDQESVAGESFSEGGALEAQVEAVLDWLQAHRYLDEARFVESRMHARSGRFGNLRIRRELAQHGVELSPADHQALKESELARAREVWAKKFGHPPLDGAERGRQMRFLAGRGFTSEVIRQVVQGGVEDE